MTAAAAGERTGAFIATKEHRRFAEFADAVRKHRYIGLCFGAAGVGKTCSARRYARWDIAEPLFSTWGPRDPAETKVYAALAQNRAIFYTPTVCCPFRELHGDIAKLITRVGVCINSHVHRDKLVQPSHSSDLAEMLIVDEAERLTNTALDHLRDLFDRTGWRDPGRDAGHRKAPVALSATLQPHWLCPSLPAVAGRRTGICADPTLAPARPCSRRCRFHRRLGRRVHRPHYGRQLPAAASSVRPDRAHPEAQRLVCDHRRRGGGCIILRKPRQLYLKATPFFVRFPVRQSSCPLFRAVD